MIDLAFEVTRSQPYVARGVTLTLPFTPPGAGERQLELINADYDAVTGQLYTFGKGCGLGDCSRATRWQFDGTCFVLAEYAEESTCDAWPTLWVSQSASVVQQR